VASLNVVAYGGGTNSTAMLIGAVHRKEPVDLILFADTGGETPRTYRYVDLFSEWLVGAGYPAIQKVHYVTKEQKRLTLEQHCLDKGYMPSLAYGFKSCSLRFKRDPQDKFVNNWKPAREAWKRGEQVTKWLGFDADEPHRAKSFDDKKYTWRYPLLEWKWGRQECIEAIAAEGLPLPGKSSCFFCPAMKKKEILALQACEPGLLERALSLEAKARPKTRGSVEGLGRRWAWADFLKAEKDQLKLFPDRVEEPCGCYDG